MPLNFPSNPTTGQTSTQNGRQYIWNPPAWELVAASGGSGLSWSSVPASATASGTAGQIAYDGEYVYLATASGTWKRAALSTWFSPAQISGLAVWAKASDATASGGNVTAWASNGVTATISGTPTLVANAQNGLSAVQFDGTSHASFASQSVLNKSSSATLFAVFKPTTSSISAMASRACYFGGSTQGNPAIGYWLREYGSATGLGAEVGNIGVANYSAGSTTLSVAWKVLAVVYSNNVLTYYVNGSQIGTVNVSSRSFTTATESALWIGSEPGGGWPSQIQFGEGVAYSSALSSNDRAAVESYLTTKWGIA